MSLGKSLQAGGRRGWRLSEEACLQSSLGDSAPGACGMSGEEGGDAGKQQGQLAEGCPCGLRGLGLQHGIRLIL